jgi:pimeloyl-ACP methyl ester carboxylesterase
MLDELHRIRLRGGDPGVEIAVLDFGGCGPAALLHHATGFCAALWAPVAERLTERFRVFAMDARGHGDSGKPPPPEAYRWDAFGRDVEAVASQLTDAHGPLALGVGHSFGGTALTLAEAARPGLFERLVLVDPVVLPADPEMRSTFGGANPMAEGARRRRWEWESRAAARTRWAARPAFAAWTQRALDLYAAEGLEERADGSVTLKCPPEVEASIFENASSVDPMLHAHRLRASVVVLWAHDGNFSREHFEEFVRPMSNGSVRALDAGHLVLMEEPDLLVEELLGPA